ncbi:hypothetical protein ACE1TI_09585 [Alteribacillus sp. JSM 102045]|uniref:hypothetical protein n=1 Tax=Alteribacillus sp. JSM 102045 TaxID=1562101 RepID=UPI0035C20BE3
MFKVGIVGPDLSVRRILDVAEEFKDELAYISFSYEQHGETADIVREHQDNVDAWLCSGPIPYAIAEKTLGSAENIYGILFLENGIYKSLINLVLQQKEMPKKISMDVPEEANIAKASIDQLDITPEKFHIKTFPAEADFKQVYNYHKKLWSDNNTEGVLTCYPQVRDLLQKEGIPSTWITTTVLETKQTLQSIVEKAKTEYYQNAQIAVCFVEIGELEFTPGKEAMSFDLQIADLKMNESLLFLSRKLNGSLLNAGNGRYMIFSSRGELEQKMNMLQQTLQSLIREWKRAVVGGIGFGDSAMRAEFNARIAVQRSKKVKEGTIIVTMEDGETIEYHPKGKEINYDSLVTDSSMLEKLKTINISAQMYEKVKSCAVQKDWSVFTAKDIALELDMSNRNAQRILSELQRAGLIYFIGEKKNHSKGRPNKVYSFRREVKD